MSYLTLPTNLGSTYDKTERSTTAVETSSVKPVVYL